MTIFESHLIKINVSRRGERLTQPKLLVTEKRQRKGEEKVNNAHWTKMTSCKLKNQGGTFEKFLYLSMKQKLDADWTGARDAHGVNREGINKRYRRWDGKLKKSYV